MRGAIPPLPQFVFKAWCLVKHRDNFTFTRSVSSAGLCLSDVELQVVMNTYIYILKCQKMTCLLMEIYQILKILLRNNLLVFLSYIHSKGKVVPVLN